MAPNAFDVYSERPQGRFKMFVGDILSIVCLRCCKLSKLPSLFSKQNVGLYVLNWPIQVWVMQDAEEILITHLIITIESEISCSLYISVIAGLWPNTVTPSLVLWQSIGYGYVLYTMRFQYIAVISLCITCEWHPYSLPVKTKYGVSFVSANLTEVLSL